MRANELRLGNWVSLNKDFKKVLWFKYDKVCVMNEYPSAIVDIDRLSPIHITEEILLKCGFEYCESRKVYQLYLPNDHQVLVGFRFQNEFKLQYRVLNVVLHETQYLHQLQNLIYALTNQELNVEL